MIILATALVFVLTGFPIGSYAVFALFQGAPAVAPSNTGDAAAAQPSTSDARSKPSAQTPRDDSMNSQTMSQSQSTQNSKQPTAPAKAKTKTSHSKKKSQAGKAGKSKVVVRHGSAPAPSLKFTPTLTQEQLTKQRQHTTELLAASDANLKTTANKQLNPAQQDAISKVRNYMQQASAADKLGDVQRAQALASKAKQLSDDLVSH